VSTDQDQNPHPDQQVQTDSQLRMQNLAYAAVAGQVGCTTVILIIGALLVGLWLDAQFGVKGPFTIILLLLSIPISLFLVLRIALGAVRAIRRPEVGEVSGLKHTGMKEE
jgi:hypothetical protein